MQKKGKRKVPTSRHMFLKAANYHINIRLLVFGLSQEGERFESLKLLVRLGDEAQRFSRSLS